MVFIGSFSLLYGLTALLTVLWAQTDGGAVVANALVMIIAVSSAVLGVLWIFGPWPTERQSMAFAVYADIAVVTVILCFQDAFTAMPGLALLATNGIYIVVVHGPRALLAHLVFTAAAFAGLYGLAIVQATQAATVITVRLLVMLPTVVGVPVIVQSHLLALRLGAVDALHDQRVLLHGVASPLLMIDDKGYVLVTDLRRSRRKPPPKLNPKLNLMAKITISMSKTSKHMMSSKKRKDKSEEKRH